MIHPENSDDIDRPLTAYFRGEDAIRSRSVGKLVLQGRLDIPLPPERLIADWFKEIQSLGLVVGDIETLPLARTIVRWPDYKFCISAVTEWLRTINLPDLLDPNELALMGCIGTHYHHDAEQYGHAAFCNLFLSEDKGMDLHFPSLALRIPLTRGTVVIFDTAQPHAVIPRGSSGFNTADFAPDQDCTQVFLTWELPIENAQLSRALKVDFDIEPVAGVNSNEQHVRLNGASLVVCPDTGQWQAEE